MDISQVIHQRIFIPSYYAVPVTIEATDLEGDLIRFRVRTEAGHLEEFTLNQEELLQVLEHKTPEESVTVQASD